MKVKGRGSIEECVIYAATIAAFTTIFVIGYRHFEAQLMLYALVYLASFVYAQIAYLCWYQFLENASPLMYDEGKDPAQMTLVWKLIGVVLPVMAVVAGALFLIALTASWIKAVTYDPYVATKYMP